MCILSYPTAACSCSDVFVEFNWLVSINRAIRDCNAVVGFFRISMSTKFSVLLWRRVNAIKYKYYITLDLDKIQLSTITLEKFSSQGIRPVA
jgi:hypothetical protein